MYSNGKMSKKFDKDRKATKWEYDPVTHRLMFVKRLGAVPLGTADWVDGTEEVSLRTAYTYDAAGRVSEVESGLGTEFARRRIGNLSFVVPPAWNGGVRIPGIRVENPRTIHLMEILLHAGTTIGRWSAEQIHSAIIERFGAEAGGYSMASLRYDLRKLKGHGLLERETGRYRYRLTEKGQRVAILFLLFHQRLCGPLAGSQFLHRPDERYRPSRSALERAYYNAHRAVDDIVSLFRAA